MSSRVKFSMTRTNIKFCNFLKIYWSQNAHWQLELNRKPGLNPKQWYLSTKTVYFLPIFSRKQKFSLLVNQIRPLPPSLFECWFSSAPASANHRLKTLKLSFQIYYSSMVWSETPSWTILTMIFHYLQIKCHSIKWSLLFFQITRDSPLIR